MQNVGPYKFPAWRAFPDENRASEWPFVVSGQPDNCTMVLTSVTSLLQHQHQHCTPTPQEHKLSVYDGGNN